MTVLQVADVGFGYGADKLFQGVTFSLDMGERASLVAPNGAGKTTLLRLVARELVPDEGLIVAARGLRVGYVRQSHELPSVGCVRDAFLSSFQDVMQMRRELTSAQHAAASGTEDALHRLADVSERYDAAGGDELERRIEMIAQHLGFGPTDMDRPLTSLSGGERGRLHLGLTLAAAPDLLLLDEPTNHLDIDTIRWLEGHLASLGSAMLCVSHDRAFLDAVFPITMELGRRSFRVYPLCYSDYTAAREDDLERERELLQRQQAMVAKTEEFIRRNIAGQKTKQAQSRRKMLEKLETLERPEDVWAVAEKVRFRFPSVPRSGDIVIEAQGLCAARGGRSLFSDFDLLVRRGERIGIVGPNGCGKSTLIRLLAGMGDANDSGSIRRGSQLAEGYYDQHLGALDPAKTAVEEIRSVRGDWNVDATRQYLSRFRFYGDDPLRRVAGLSGGERSRLALAKLLLLPKNLLFLDEPTNHLDIPAAEILEEALCGFDGTLFIVSHDRRLLEAVTTRILAFALGGIDIYPGGFRDYQAHWARHNGSSGSSPPDSAKAGRVATAPAVSDTLRGPSEPRQGRAVRRSASTVLHASEEPLDAQIRKRAFEAEKAVARALERKRRRVRDLEAEIAAGEADLARMRERLKADPGGDWAKLAEMVKTEQALSRRVDAAVTEWMALSEELGVATGGTAL